jgi:hypothetical protein
MTLKILLRLSTAIEQNQELINTPIDAIATRSELIRPTLSLAISNENSPKGNITSPAKTDERPLDVSKKKDTAVARNTVTMKVITKIDVGRTIAEIELGEINIPTEAKKKDEKTRLNERIECSISLRLGKALVRLPARKAPIAGLKPKIEARALRATPRVKENNTIVSVVEYLRNRSENTFSNFNNNR